MHLRALEEYFPMPVKILCEHHFSGCKNLRNERCILMHVCVYFNLISAYLKEWILMKLAILMQNRFSPQTTGVLWIQ